MPTYLDAIVSAHRSAAAKDRRTRSDLEALPGRPGEPRSFARALRDGLEGAAGLPIGVIAEVKRRSPSKGPLAESLDPGALARSYAAGGASCLSVLTDAAFFGGSPADLQAARSSVGLPVLRKDFTVCEADVYEARAMGADAVLLIVAALDEAELVGLSCLARELGLEALVEVHDEAELDRALGAGARLIGVNQRDLHSFEVDRRRAERVAAAIPDGVVKVAESGITSSDDLARLAEVGFHGALVGEALVTADDPCAALLALRGVTADSSSGAVQR